VPHTIWTVTYCKKITHFQNQEEYSRMKNMVLKWSYKHHLLIKMETA